MARPLLFVSALLLAAPAGAVTCTVTSTADTNAAGTLRGCIEKVNSTPGRDDIVFSASVFNPGTITLSTELPTLDDDSGAVIDGAEARLVIVDCANQNLSRGFGIKGRNTIIRNLTVRRCAGSGFGSGDGIDIEEGAQGARVEHLRLEDNGGSGVFMLNTQRTEVHITDCVITQSGATAIHLQGNVTPDGGCGAVRSTVERNVVSEAGAGAGEGGIYVIRVDCVDVLDNDVTGSRNTALKVSSSSTAIRVSGNHAHDNISDGVGVFGGAHHNEISHNLITGSPDNGIDVGDVGTTDNLVAANVIASNNRGLFVFDGAHRTRIFNNTVFGSQGDGISITGLVVGLVARNNLAISNQGTGIDDSSAASSTWSHSISFGNGLDFKGVTPDQSCNPKLDAGYAISTCASCAVDQGLDLAADQPDLTGPGDGLKYYGPAPDVGAVESACGRPDPPPDAGLLPDGGMAVTSRALTVACGCDATGGGVALFGLGLALLRRRRSGRTA